ncbi:MAG: GDP-fucose synthetase [Acidobacteria bacterium]|nr:MAG: GDP-fucose synthetase [Acidobacteriota bacterium]
MPLPRSYPLEGKRVWVTGHAGMVGSALVRRLSQIKAVLLTTTRTELDLRDQSAVNHWVHQNCPDAVFIAAATVGGIEANRTRPAEFLFDNLMIAANIIHAAAETGVRKLMFLGSSCFYPREAEQPIREESILTGPFEPTNEWYAVAKVAGVKLCQAYRQQHGKDFIVVVPTNLYGPGDNFDLVSGHVIPALIRRLHEARVGGVECAELWGTGKAIREFLYVDDAVDAMVFLMERYSEDAIINIAGGEEISIAALAERIAAVVHFHGRVRYDDSKPDGMPRKVLDGSRLLKLGWRPAVSLHEGLTRTYEWFLDMHNRKDAKT